MVQTPERVLKEIKTGKFQNCYFLHGDESFFIDEISEQIENNAIPEAERGFNQMVIYGKETSVSTILQQARRFPVMAEKQVIIVKEFQQLPDLNKGESKKMLEMYLQKLVPSTILVFCHKHKSLKKNTTLYKAFDKNAIVVESKKLNENKTQIWIDNYLKTKKQGINAKAKLLLLEAVGTDLGRLKTEIDKLLLNLKESTEINEELLEKYIGISKEYNIFELQNALGRKDVLKINRILRYWEANPKAQPLIPTLAMLLTFFSKLLLGHSSPDKTEKGLASALGIPPFFVREYQTALKNYSLKNVIYAVAQLREADLQVKGIKARNLSDAEILKAFIHKVVLFQYDK